MKLLGIFIVIYLIFKFIFSLFGFISNEVIWIFFGLCVFNVFSRCCIVSFVFIIFFIIMIVCFVMFLLILIIFLMELVDDIFW